jgi:dolichol-phosphate mannosyltransferase
MVAWSGFRRIILPFQASERLAGTSKYSFRKMFSLFLSAIFSFSLVPLFLSISLGVIFLGLAAFQSIYVLAFWIRGEANLLAPGWSSMMFVLLLLGGILMVALGFIGIYVGYIFQEVKGRPVYLISKVLGEKHPGKDSKG